MNRKRWEPKDIAFVRDNYGKVPAIELAAELGRTVSQVRDCARRLRICRKILPAKRWNDADLAILRREYAKRPAGEIAAMMGRSVQSVYQRARVECLGMTIRPWSQDETETLKAMNGDGCTDTDIAKKLGRDRHAVSARRKSLGLPSNEKGEQWRQAIRDGVNRQCDRLGVARVSDLRTEAFRKFARESGWPEDLRPREVQILNVLAARGVPMNRLELSEAIGMRKDRLHYPCGKTKNPTLNLLTGNGPGGTYTASLMRRGLLLSLRRGAQVLGQGTGKSRSLYFLSPAAITILEENACRMQTGQMAKQDSA